MNTELDYLAYLRTVIQGPGHAERVIDRDNKIEAYINSNRQRLRTLEVRMRKTSGAGKRIIWVRKAAEVLAEATRGNVYCRDGCASCCHMPTMVTLEEAKLIAKETGAALTVPAGYTDLPESHFHGEPCSFLQERRCSIYASRPMSCRMHYALADDAALCKVEKDKPLQAAHFNPDLFSKLYALAHMEKATTVDELNLADLRTFFPNGLNASATSG